MVITQELKHELNAAEVSREAAVRDGSNANAFARRLKDTEVELAQSRADLAESRAEAAKMKV